MRAKEFLSESYEFFVESPADDIINALTPLGFEPLTRDTGKTVSLRVMGDRKKVIQDIVNKLPGSVYDPNAGSSSIGGIKFKGGLIKVRPADKAGVESAGIKNEYHLINTIKKFASEFGSIDITFVGDNGQNITISKVTSAEGSGKDIANRKKSDIILYSGDRVVPISIKKSNAAYWESADTLFGKQADDIITKLAKSKAITLTPIGSTRSDGTPKVKINPEVAIKASPQQTLDVVFGSDILPHGAIVKQTFHDEHYSLNGNHLTITTDLVIRKPEDIPPNLQVYFLIRNDSTRNRPGSKYPGLRVLGSYASRVKNALKVDPADLPAANPAPVTTKKALKVSRPTIGAEPKSS